MDWQAEFDQLRAEIEAYSPDLAQKPYCVVFSKMDLLGDDPPPPIDAPGAFGVLAISAPGRKGLEQLLKQAPVTSIGDGARYAALQSLRIGKRDAPVEAADVVRVDERPRSLDGRRESLAQVEALQRYRLRTARKDPQQVSSSEVTVYDPARCRVRVGT